MSDAAIVMENVSFRYGDTEVLKEISFQGKEGESIGLVGANGAGKSTFLKLLVGLLPDYQGNIQVCGIRVEKQNLSRIRAKTGYVFQDSESQLFLSTVYDDVAFAPRNYGYSKEEVDRRVQEALKRIHITHLQNKAIYRMSGGEKKLASIATILSMTPDIILLDEPSIALDPKNRRNLIHVLNELPQLKLIASHDLDMILDTCSRTILIGNGRIMADGDTQSILTDKALLEENGLELPLCLQRK